METLSRASRARRIAVKAVYGGTGLGLLGLLAAGVLIGQARRARQLIPVATEAPPRCDGVYGTEFVDDHDGRPLELAMLGDSTAAGLGVDLPEETPGVLIATALARALRRPVRLRCLAVVGAKSRQLSSQVDQLLAVPPEVAVICVGGNDVTNRTRPAEAVRNLDRAVRRLVAKDVKVVVGTCPDLGAIAPIRPPLRWLARRWSRELAAAQTIAVVNAGGRTVSIGDLLGPQFEGRPEMFAPDQFHPSALGYARAAEVLIPSTLAALGYDETLAPTPDAAWAEDAIPRQGVRRLARAAVEAADTAGTEVAPVTDATGRQGLWGELRNRLAWLAALVPEGVRRTPEQKPDADRASTVVSAERAPMR